jgi:hypothetical protein
MSAQLCLKGAKELIFSLAVFHCIKIQKISKEKRVVQVFLNQ